MPPPTALKTKKAKGAATDGDAYDSDASHDDFDKANVMEKDETEAALEKLLFGDDVGFKSALAAYGQDDDMSSGEGSADEAAEGADEDMGGFNDADLFFVDSGPSNALIPAADDTSASESESEDALHPAAWEDSDDERITVSLASHARLRKLRTTEADDIVNGKEYSRRLRRQYERLYPVPEWANPAATKKSQSRKKRRLSDGSASSSGDDANANEMEIDSDADEDSSNDTFSTAPLAQLLQDAGSLVSAHQSKSQLGKRKLQPEVLSIQRLKDVGDAQPSSVDSLSFHPTHPILLSSGPSKTLFLHQINSTTTTSTSSEPHPLLTTLHIRNVPLMNTVFTPSGTEIYLAGRRRYFHIWSLANGAVTKVPAPSLIHTDLKTTEHFRLSPCGRFLGLIGSGRKGGGSIHILSTTTSQVQESIRVDGRGGIADFAWWSDGEGMVIANHNGEVSEYDRVQRRIVARWIDEGAVGTTTITLGGRSGRSELGGDRWVAVGSSSGIVNIYDRRTWLSPSTSTSTSSNSKDSTNAFSIPHAPKPHRALDNLTTPISHLHFAPDGHILVMASRWKRNALRVVHLPTATVFKNWPTSNTPLGRISSVALTTFADEEGRNERYRLAVGNEAGRIRLWEILK